MAGLAAVTGQSGTRMPGRKAEAVRCSGRSRDWYVGDLAFSLSSAVCWLGNPTMTVSQVPDLCRSPFTFREPLLLS